MKKRTVLLSILLAAALFLGWASAAGGDAGDPLISLDYLQSVFAPKAEKAMQEKLNAAGKAVYATAETTWHETVAAAEAAAGAERANTWTETRLKQGDILSGLTGTQVMLLAGGVSAQFSTGAIVDVTDGTELPSGGELKMRHRYMVAEDTTALFTTISRTAVVEYCGDYHFTLSGTSPDYNVMASALKTLSLLKGTGVGYGEGFELEVTPTRIQALIMLIRMLGEEDAALQCASPAPFRDIPDDYWGRAYIAYAAEKGYTNGVEDNLFAPDRATNAGMYIEFILRALGYSDTTQTDITTAAARAQNVGVLTSGERAVLETNAFLRADVAYLSWYALDVPVASDMQPLHQKLESAGVFTASDYQRAKSLVASPRL
ncbi:MAG: S-layer homology domain-containing protein [Oscillospiraceae bacterium]|nr:S-layer homology domain-containing protein [Oscillospiraceae bacterium]